MLNPARKREIGCYDSAVAAQLSSSISNIAREAIISIDEAQEIILFEKSTSKSLAIRQRTVGQSLDFLLAGGLNKGGL